MEQINRVLVNVHENREIKAVVIAAEGKAFSAGADVGEHTPEKAGDLIASFGRLFRLLRALDVPIVMAVDGAALGAGFELILMADVLIAGEAATFGQPEIRLGFFAPVGVALLPSLVGRARAMEITASGRVYTAREMHDFGLVTRVVGAGEIEEATEAVLKDFRRASPLILQMNVRMLKELEDKPFEEALTRAEQVFLEELMKTEDVREGIASFFEKRKPVWKNA
jgi:cyclohexa-1,5-dienecarbonyl-CoA hydratase